jgi:prevent-host-death family protein
VAGPVVLKMVKTYNMCMTSAHPDDVEVTVTDARGQLPELLETRVREGGVVYLTRYGRRVGAVVPADVAERMEELEDAYWSRRAAEAEAKFADEPPIPWEQVVAVLEDEDASDSL